MAMKSRVERSSLTQRVTEAMLELIAERKLGDGDPRPSTTEPSRIAKDARRNGKRYLANP